MDGASGSRTLGAANDLVELLRLAQSAAERLEQEVFGPQFEHAELIARDMQRLRRSAEKLQADIGRFVAREQSQTSERGHPPRQSTLIASLGAKRPSRMLLASGFSISDWMARFSGRAP